VRPKVYFSFLAVVTWSIVHTYLAIRSERVRTRLSMRISDGEHEMVVALPSGQYQIQFTTGPNTSPAVMVPDHPVLPAVITTKLARADGRLILEPATGEYVTFSIEGMKGSVLSIDNSNTTRVGRWLLLRK
jgi:hypothetical protein